MYNQQTVSSLFCTSFIFSHPDRIRDFIRSVYVNKKYAGERSSEMSPKDTEVINCFVLFPFLSVH